jgi:CIC family chloride channel protein
MTRMRVPTILAPALGGAAVALLAMLSPHVLSAGHGALELVVAGQAGATVLLAVFVLKLIASAVSIGSGFRGGLFSTSLFAGALLGGGIGALLIGNGLLGPEAPGAITLMAMCAFAAAVVGAPLAMVLLAMEITGRIEFLPDALLAIVAATVTARALFGYSFSTWRLHVRGSAVRSARDITWTSVIRVRFMVQRSPASVDATIGQLLTVSARFRQARRPGCRQRALCRAVRCRRGRARPTRPCSICHTTRAPAGHHAQHG